jgi:Mrp family chromosome partitioning ATPase
VSDRQHSNAPAGGAAGAAKLSGSQGSPGREEERKAIARRLSRIKHKIIVMSGKGGVGKSTVAVNLAYTLAHHGCRVGLLDIDIHGPNVPKMLGIEGKRITGSDSALKPVLHGPNLKLMSIGFLLRSASDAVIWRGPLKMRIIEQFIKDVEWEDLDFLIVDAPPGTGDEPLSVCQMIDDADGALIVTTPQEVALTDIRKSITFCRQVSTRVLGVIENMSGFVCPHCGQRMDLFKSGGGARVAKEMQVPFLGEIPFDATVVDAGDSGVPITALAGDCAVTRAMRSIIERLGFGGGC